MTDQNSMAFPAFDSDGAAGKDKGLTKLEYFTAAAMTGVLAGDIKRELNATEVSRIACIIAINNLQRLQMLDAPAVAEMGE